MSSRELEKVKSESMKTEVDTSDMLVLDTDHYNNTVFDVLEPLQDHDYTSPQSSTEKTPVTNIKKPKTRKLKKLPKITKIMALYKCKLCGYSTMKKDVIETHKETHKNIQPGTKYIPCATCSVNKTPKSMMDDGIQCPQCSFTTRSASSLKVHIIRVHTLGKPYKCSECDFNGKDLKDLVEHYKTAKNFCDLCSFSSHIKKKMLAHQKLHDKKSKVWDGHKMTTLNV